MSNPQVCSVRNIFHFGMSHFQGVRHGGILGGSPCAGCVSKPVQFASIDAVEATEDAGEQDEGVEVIEAVDEAGENPGTDPCHGVPEFAREIIHDGEDAEDDEGEDVVAEDGEDRLEAEGGVESGERVEHADEHEGHREIENAETENHEAGGLVEEERGDAGAEDQGEGSHPFEGWVDDVGLPIGEIGPLREDGFALSGTIEHVLEHGGCVSHVEQAQCPRKNSGHAAESAENGEKDRSGEEDDESIASEWVRERVLNQGPERFLARKVGGRSGADVGAGCDGADPWKQSGEGAPFWEAFIPDQILGRERAAFEHGADGGGRERTDLLSILEEIKFVGWISHGRRSLVRE